MSEIKIYHWWSRAMKQYASGHLIAYGTTPDEARDRILSGLEEMVRYKFDYCFSEDGTLWDEDDAERIQRFRDQIAEDLKAEPDEYQSLYINGSE